MSVLLETSVGDIVIDLFIDECPKTCINFLKLCKVKYYNYNLFHSVQPGFITETGTGDTIGSGDRSSSIFGLIDPTRRFFDLELHPTLRHDKRGIVSMSSCRGADGNFVNASQFFITFGQQELRYLDDQHTVFGEVSEGLDTLDTIESVFCDEQRRPLKDIRIHHTVILHDPFDDPAGLVIPGHSPWPTEDVLESTRFYVDESLEEVDEDSEEYQRQQRRKEAVINSTTLEILGDLPFADVKPPENVLFVCKLNPVTRSEDLSMIFSRFGVIKSSEVIMDTETGKSLQYAFIEFEERSACEEAYFKMQNVLIDDRRIHVDFSQSVSKLEKVWRHDRRRMDEFGGEGLYRRQQYRNDSGTVSSRRNYEMVFAQPRSRKGY